MTLFADYMERREKLYECEGCGCGCPKCKHKAKAKKDGMDPETGKPLLKGMEKKMKKEDKVDPEHIPGFLEYLNSKGKTLEKPKVKELADEVDMPTPKAKEDPHKKNKSKSKLDQVKEFMNSQGKLVDKPRTEKVADYTGPDPAAPPKDQRTNLGYDNPKAEGQPSNYRAPASGMSAAGRESGFGDMGDKKLNYEPKTDTETAVAGMHGGKTVGTWPKGKNEAFLDLTAGMPNSEFAKAILENKNNVDDLVLRFRRAGCLNNLLESILQLPEAYTALVSLLEDDTDGDRRCRALVREMNKSYIETVGPPFPIEDEEEDEDDEEMGDEEMGDEDMEDDELGDEMDMDDEDELGDEMDMDDEDLDGEAPPPDLDGGMMGDEMPMPKKKKKGLAHKKLIGAMGNFSHMKKAMLGM